jgi:hypothetical protein
LPLEITALSFSFMLLYSFSHFENRKTRYSKFCISPIKCNHCSYAENNLGLPFSLYVLLFVYNKFISIFSVL